MPSSLNLVARKAWTRYAKLLYPQVATTDKFCSFQEYMDNPNIDFDTIELMCHPGGIYDEEEALLLKVDIEKSFNVQLINYNIL